MRIVLVVMSVALLGCGAQAVTPADDVVSGAQESLEKTDAARIDLALEASAEGSETVGFALRGAYEFGNAELAVVDLTYVLDTGQDSVESRVVSDGKRAVVVAGDEVVEVPSKQARALRIGKGSAPALPGLDLASWIRDAEVTTKGDRSEVRGKLRAGAFIADLQRVAGNVAGSGGAEISGEGSERLDDSVTDSSVVLVTEGKDHELRSLEATIDFGARVPEELRKALGSYAGARLELTVRLDEVKTPLEVKLPS